MRAYVTCSKVLGHLRVFNQTNNSDCWVAFQNRVAYAMGGFTMHSAAGIKIGNQKEDLGHTDVDVLYTNDQALRWILIDEIFMVGDNLLGEFSSRKSAAAQNTIYRARADGTLQIFAGYNLLVFGDTAQLPPIPSSSALFLPPATKANCGPNAKEMLDMFWGDGVNTINYFVELKQQMRLEDTWYSAYLDECRLGDLSDENYNFLCGLPTEHCGSWLSTDSEAKCGSKACANLPRTWKEMRAAGKLWASDMQPMECEVCSEERARRCRLLEPNDKRLHKEPFIYAPYIHQNNDPKYHAMLLRAAEHAKRGFDKPRHIIWTHAVDEISNPKEIAKTFDKICKKQDRMLQFHDQKTAGIPGILPLFEGMKARVTEKVSFGHDFQQRSVMILKHTSCTVVGWKLQKCEEMTDHKTSQRVVQHMPEVIYLKFDKAEWQISKDLEKGVSFVVVSVT